MPRIAAGPPTDGSTGFERNWYAIRIHTSGAATIYSRATTHRFAHGYAKIAGITTFNNKSPLWKRYGYLFAEDEDDGELPCGCIDVCRSNCDGRRDRY